MAVDMFLKLDGIEGEAQDAVHHKEIDVLAWSWGASQSGTTHMGAGGGAGKTNIQDVSFTHYVDAASNNLLQRVFDGRHIKTGELVVRKSGGTPLDYITIKMEDIIVTSLSTGGSGGEDRLTENVTLNFSKVKFIYRPQKSDGSADAEQVAGWDISKSSAL